MKSILLLLVVILSLGAIGVVTPKVIAGSNPLEAACSGGGGNSAACNQARNQGTTDPVNDGLINQIIQIIAMVAGIAAVITVILGGIKLITSGGEAQKVSSGRSQIFAGLIGVVIVALSYLIISFVVGQLIR